MEYKFTKKHTQIAKGLAILLMVIHHLFGFPNRTVSYVHILNNINIEYYLADFGEICVSMYLFLSGYGLYISHIQNNFKLKDSIRVFKKFFLNYWSIFIIFVPIGLIFFRSNPNYKFSIVKFIENAITISSSYNKEWWFAQLYLELVILFPIINLLLKKHSKKVFFLSIAMNLLTIVPLIILMPIKRSFIFNEINSFAFWQIAFVVGCIFAKYNLFKIMSTIINKNYLYILIIMISFIIRHYVQAITNNAVYIDCLLTPLVIYSFTSLIYNSKFKKLNLMLGKHSTNIWLIHTFFIYYYWQPLIFKVKFSVLILVWTLVLTIISSIIIDFLSLEVFKIINRIYKSDIADAKIVDKNLN